MSALEPTRSNVEILRCPVGHALKVGLRRESVESEWVPAFLCVQCNASYGYIPLPSGLVVKIAVAHLNSSRTGVGLRNNYTCPNGHDYTIGVDLTYNTPAFICETCGTASMVVRDELTGETATLEFLGEN